MARDGVLRSNTDHLERHGGRDARTAEEEHGARRRRADVHRVGQDLLHARVRRERRALADADARELTTNLGVDRLQRLALDDLVEVLPVVEVQRERRVERLSRGSKAAA